MKLTKPAAAADVPRWARSAGAVPTSSTCGPIDAKADRHQQQPSSPSALVCTTDVVDERQAPRARPSACRSPAPAGCRRNGRSPSRPDTTRPPRRSRSRRIAARLADRHRRASPSGASRPSRRNRSGRRSAARATGPAATASGCTASSTGTPTNDAVDALRVGRTSAIVGRQHRVVASSGASRRNRQHEHAGQRQQHGRHVQRAAPAEVARPPGRR